MSIVLKVIRVALEYGMLLWLLYFVARIAARLFGEARAEARQNRKPETRQDEAILTVVEAQEQELAGRRFAFGREISIGRGAENDIVIPEAFVSHHHAVLYRHGSQYVIEDLGSRNHTYVNDHMLTGKAYIRPGDIVRIGMVSLRFER